jgi:hypothetical protein
MGRHIDHSGEASRRRRRVTAILFAGVGLAVTGTGVMAALNATAFNSSAQTITSGTLKLVLSDNGNGFTQSITDMAPGDIVNRYVDLANSGTLDGKNLTLTATDSGSTLLSTDSTKGLHVTVVRCSGGTWTAGTGVCSGSTSTLLSNVALANMGSAQSLISGAVTAATTYHLKVSVTLPDQNETTTNGTLPGGTIQGLTANVTWTFGESQRDATTTNS